MKHLTLILFIIPTFLFGQGWEMIYEEGVGNSVQQSTDGGYIVTGSIFGINDDYVLLLKTDEYGGVLWINGYGKFLPDVGYSVKQTTDDGYIISGLTMWYQDFFDVYLIKTDEYGDTLWTKHYGGEDSQVGNSVIQNTDGGYVIAGSTEIDTYNTDIYLIKTDENGDTLWTKHYGDSILSDQGYSIQQIAEGGYIVAGCTGSDGAGWDAYLMKTDENGDTLWGKKYGSPNIHEKGFSVQQATDGGFIVSGFSIDVSNTSSVYLLKTDNDGETQWSKTYSGNTNNIGNSVQQTTDGGYIIAGGAFGVGSASGMYLIKTDENGDTLWTRIYENCSRGGNSVQQTVDGGYIITGNTGSSSDSYIYLLKTDENGLITSTTEIPVPNPNRKLLKSVDLSGREITNPKSNHPYIEIYDDGTTQKKMKLK